MMEIQGDEWVTAADVCPEFGHADWATAVYAGRESAPFDARVSAVVGGQGSGQAGSYRGYAHEAADAQFGQLRALG